MYGVWKNMEFSAIILAAGSGSRTGLNYNKVFHKIHRKRVLDYSIEFFRNYSKCTEILLICSEHDVNFVREEYGTMVTTIVIGGATRQESVYKGLNKATKPYVLVHDSARPFLNKDNIDQLVACMIDTKAATLAIPVIDSIVKVSGNRLTKTLDREEFVALQTPQAFLTELLLHAHEKARKRGYFATDDTDLIRKFTNVMPSYVEGDYRSIKLTNKEDIALLEVIL